MRVICNIALVIQRHIEATRTNVRLPDKSDDDKF